MGAKGIQTRRRLLEAVEGLLRTVPLRDLRVAQIVKAARTSTSTFYVYFNDVPEAVLALTGTLSQSAPGLLGLFAGPWPEAAAWGYAHEFVAGYVEQYEANAPIFRVRNLASDEGDARFSEQRINAVRPLIEAMASRIREVRDRAHLPPNLDPHSAAGALLALIERIGVYRPNNTDGVTRARLIDVAAFFSVLLFSGRPVSFEPSDQRSPRAAKMLVSPQAEAAGPVRGLKNQHGQSVGAKGEKTRQRILEAVEDLVQWRSLLDLTVADIVRAAKTSNATFYLYFQDVAEAVLTITAEISQTTPELVDLLQSEWRGQNPDEKAIAFVREYTGRWQAHRALFRVRNLAADEGDHRFYRARAAAVRPLSDILTEKISRTQAAGRLPLGLHPRSTADGFLAMLERLAVTPNVDTGGVTTGSIGRAVAYFLSVLVCGLDPERIP